MDHFITETYFNWLKSETFNLEQEQRQFEGVLRVLHDIPFTWLYVADDSRSGDATAFRQSEFIDRLQLPRDTDLVALGQWATAAPSVLEVLLGCARRYSFYFDEYETPFFFRIMFFNMGFHQLPGRSLNPIQQASLREAVDIWLNRQFQPNGVGSPWPLNAWRRTDVDQRTVDIWAQMNAYSAQHFQ